VNQRIEIAVRQSLRFCRHVGLVKIAQENGCETFYVADAGAMVVPGGTRGLIRLVEILDIHLVHEPQQGRRIAGYVAALTAGLVVPELCRRDAFIPAIESLHGNGLVLISNAVDHYLAIFLEFPHHVAHIFDAILIRQHRTPVDDLIDPHGRNMSIFFAQVCVGPFRPVSSKTVPTITCRHSLNS